MKELYEAIVTCEGGRSNGHIRSEDGTLDLNLKMPEAMAGDGLKPNPEMLFAGAYAACFETALQVSAQKLSKPLNNSKVRAHVILGQGEDGNFQLAAKLDVFLPGYGKDDGEKILQEAHRICPYSIATRNNIEVSVNLLES